jgi:TPR repeat protein
MTKYSPNEADANNGSTYTAEFLRVKGLAERGVANAQHSLGFMYFNGQGVAQSFELAVVWYRQAAQAGWSTRSTTSA